MLSKGIRCSKMEGYSSIHSPRTNDSITIFETAKSNSQRKDTKDSGYGESLHELEEDLQNLPDWCRQCLKANEGSYIDGESSEKEAGLSTNEEAWASKREDVEDEAEDDERENVLEQLECKSNKIDEPKEKPAKRHRRITPVPLSTPIKLSLGSTSDCLFVEEEDAEDIQLYNSDEDFVDQGFLPSLSESPRECAKLLSKLQEIKTDSEISEMDQKDREKKPTISFSRSVSEITQYDQSPGVVRRNRQETLDKRSTSQLADEIPSLTEIPLPRLYLRTLSENGTKPSCSPDLRRRIISPLSSADFKGECFLKDSVQEADVNFEAFDQCSLAESQKKDNKGKLFQEAEIPQIDLQPAGPLPHWMREAKAEDVAIEISTDENSSNDGFSKNTPSVKMRNQENRSTKTGLAKSKYKSCQSEFDEDIIKIYKPVKEIEGKKQKRSRKLTPAKAASPSLEKLVDLQNQVFDFSLAESDDEHYP